MVAAVSNAIGASNVAFRKSLDSISSVVCSSCHLFVYPYKLNGICRDIYSSQISVDPHLPKSLFAVFYKIQYDPEQSFTKFTSPEMSFAKFTVNIVRRGEMWVIMN